MIAPNGLAVKPLDMGAVGAVQLYPRVRRLWRWGYGWVQSRPGTFRRRYEGVRPWVRPRQPGGLFRLATS
jgi:hypothetical protein